MRCVFVARAMNSKCHIYLNAAEREPFRTVGAGDARAAHILINMWCGRARERARRQVGAHGADKYSLNAHLAAPAAIKACGLRSKFNFSRSRNPPD